MNGLKLNTNANLRPGVKNILCYVMAKSEKYFMHQHVSWQVLSSFKENIGMFDDFKFVFYLFFLYLFLSVICFIIR